MVELDGETEQREVFFQQIRQRIMLPWRPTDLHNHLIILRRRNGKNDEYVEDLRVRRALLQRLLALFTRRGHWRSAHGEEPVHKFYKDFDWRPAGELEELFPDDAVPDGLHFRDMDESQYVTELDCHTFQHWLTEGRHNCEIAQALLHTWINDLQTSAHETLASFFSIPCSSSRLLIRLRMLLRNKRSTCFCWRLSSVSIVL